MTPVRYLFGPVTQEFADQNLSAARESGTCRCFGPTPGLDLQIGPEETWESILAQSPEGWRPDFVAAYLQYNVVPSGIWQAPVPIVGLAGDWNLLWHGYRRAALPFCDLVLTDSLGVELMQKAGFAQVRRANLFGLPRATVEYKWLDQQRDIDVLFVGNVQPAVQRERLPFLGRLAALGRRRNVVIRSGVFGDEYRQLLARSRIVFNRSIRGECNLRAFEAVAAGALLFQEAGNREVPLYLREGEEYVAYADDKLEATLEHYLENETERVQIALAARGRIAGFSFAKLWQDEVDRIESELSALSETAVRRRERFTGPDLLGRAWQMASCPNSPDPSLRPAIRAALDEQPRDAGLLNARGVVALTSGRGVPEAPIDAARSFQDAWTADPQRLVAGLNLAETLVALGQRENAVDQAVRVLAMLDECGGLDASGLDDLLFPLGFDFLRVEWERAASQHAGDFQGESRAKTELLRWRLHMLLGELTGDPLHFSAACLLRPDLPTTRAGLGAALAKRGRFAEAIPHLEEAVRGNPFNAQAAGMLYDMLGGLGLSSRQQALVRARQLLCKSSTGIVAPEPWFADTPAPDLTVAAPETAVRVVWQGSQEAVHSLALVNRNLCAALQARGHELSLEPPTGYEPPGTRVALPDALAERLRAPLSGVDVHVRHRWPPDFTPPAQGRWVVIQPWEFGSIPRAWIVPLRDQVDELWVPTRFVRNCFVRDGVPERKVHVVPNGVSDIFFRDDVAPFSLKTGKRFKFLFVGGTLPRKGFDLLLKAYAQVFFNKDDVCLVVKDMGVGTFYQGQTAEAQINQLRSVPAAPEIEYISDELTEEQMAALYRACDCVVQPFRGEGFCLPVAEAMASARPVITTGFGPVLDYATDETAYLLPYRVAFFAERRIGDLETVDTPFLVEPHADSLRYLLRRVVEQPDEARKKGEAARAFVGSRLTWAHAAVVVEARLAALRDGRSAPSFLATVGRRPKVTLAMIVKNEEKNLAACLSTIADLVDEIVIVDTGSTDRTVEIALQFGAQVAHFEWIDHFAAARNVSLDHATGEWVFWMDADDRLDAENREKLRRLFAELPDENVAFVVKCLCLPAHDTGVSTIVDHIRLFRNLPGLRWEHRIHEQILPGLKDRGATARWSDVVVHHVGYQDPALRERKLERDMRILLKEHAELGDHPFTLFNLGNIYNDMGKTAEALDMYRRSLSRSAPQDSIVRKLFAAVAQCERLLSRPTEALAVCKQGQSHYPEDAELLFQESLALAALGKVRGAIAVLEGLLSGTEGVHFASVHAGIRGHLARHNLAMYLLEIGRSDEAVRQLQLALAENPNFVPSLVQLGSHYLKNGQAGLEEIIGRLRQMPQGAVEAEVLRGRSHLTRQEFAAARAILEAVIAQHPKAVRPRVFLSHVLLQEGKDLAAAERIMREVLELDPNDTETRSNLEILLRERGPR